MTIFTDFIQALRVGSTTLEGRTLNFIRPNMVLWTKSTVCVYNVPYSVDEEEIFLRFESRKLWGRELDVRQVTPDKPLGIAYITYNNERGKNTIDLKERSHITKFSPIFYLKYRPFIQPVIIEHCVNGDRLNNGQNRFATHYGLHNRLIFLSKNSS